MKQQHKEAFKKLVEITKNSLNYIEEVKEVLTTESYTTQIEMRKAQLEFFESRLKEYSFSIDENPILNKLLKIGQTLRQKHRDNPLLQN